MKAVTGSWVVTRGGQVVGRHGGAVRRGGAVPMPDVVAHRTPFVESKQKMLHEGFCVSLALKSLHCSTVSISAPSWVISSKNFG